MFCFLFKGDMSKAQSLNDQLVKLGCRAEDAAIASLISLYGKQHKLKKAIEVFSAVEGSPTTGKLIYISMIDAYAKCGEAEEAYRLYEEVNDKGIEVGVVALSKVVHALANCGNERTKLHVLWKMICSLFDIFVTVDGGRGAFHSLMIF